MNFLALFVAAMVSLASAHVDRDAKRSFPTWVAWECTTRPSSLDWIGCAKSVTNSLGSQMYTPRAGSFTFRSNCFKNDFFTQCVDALLLKRPAEAGLHGGPALRKTEITSCP
ncbi:hypothetical protein CEXT_784611 [Caerostris extrusa]|uniref:Secreted protein n=1 Tax=Caerostris extrusa TaxID=172846 RepID=A0AAV4R3U0_CAEEX|nr:hypothetical protein CEXT_784611 [Caerostris extrusa]